LARCSASIRFGQRRFGHRPVLDFQHRRFGLPLAAFTYLIGFGLLDQQFRLRSGDLGLSQVFTGDRAGVGLGDLHAHLLFRLLDLRFPLEGRLLLADHLLLFQRCDADRLVAFGTPRADGLFLACIGHLNGFVAFGGRDPRLAHTQVVGDVATSLLDGFRSRFLADRVDVAGFVRDVRDIDVDQLQADLVQFRFQRGHNVRQEPFPVAVDLLDVHRGDNLTQLAENDFFRLLADLGQGQAKQPNRGVLHDVGLGVDSHREHAGHVDADVLRRQGAAQGDLDLDRLQAQVGIVLQQRHDERRTAVDRRGRVPRSAGLAENHQHPVARAAFELLHEQHEEAEHDDTHADGDRCGPDRPATLSQQDQI
jgi:hypothetical protein